MRVEAVLVGHPSLPRSLGPFMALREDFSKSRRVNDSQDPLRPWKLQRNSKDDPICLVQSYRDQDGFGFFHSLVCFQK